jgi:hypothetical protein
MKLDGRTFMDEVKRLPVIVALLVLAGAGAFHVYVLNPAQSRLESLERSLEKRMPRAQPARAPRLTANAEIASQLEGFYAFFGGELTYVDWLARFYDAADRSGITMQRVQYRTIETPGIPLVLHEVSLPATANYAKLRAFSESVLTHIPVASLDQITVKRSRANDAEVEAELRFTFYLARP